MAGNERRRNEATLPDYKDNVEQARLGRAEPRALMAALQGDQEATNRFFMAREGMIDPAPRAPRNRQAAAERS